MGQYLGINKGEHHAGVALLTTKNSHFELEVWPKERLSQKKYAGGFPFQELEMVGQHLADDVEISHNSFGHHPIQTEKLWQENYPFRDLVEKKGLQKFSALFNQNINFFGHHLAHAWAALAQSPFENSLILVIDGVGQDEEAINFQTQNSVRRAESITLYRQEASKLTELKKIWQTFYPSQQLFDEEGYDPEDLSDGLAYFYSLAAKFIFNSFHESGKVMGLAPFGHNSLAITDPLQFWQQMNWQNRYVGDSKKCWEQSPHYNSYCDLASSVQEFYEQNLLKLLIEIKKTYPTQDNIIITGGGALNCVANQKIFASGIFDQVFIPSAPSDESIAPGLAFGSLFTKKPQLWKPTPIKEQHLYLGPKSSADPTSLDFKINSLFPGESITTPMNLAQEVATLLTEHKVVAVFRGQSELGPRALGNRSILAHPSFPGLKDYLNQHIKFRENFRPYGATLRAEDATRYFAVPAHFHSPFMSFTPSVREIYREQLKEVLHVDGTSRIQTLEEAHNPWLFEVLSQLDKMTGLGVVLNTSLNIMGRPIVETLEHLAEFFKQSQVDALVCGNFLIYNSRKGSD